jgi:ATP adenylyltransferase
MKSVAAQHSHLTAISRKRISLPSEKLFQDGRAVGRVLDFGCGRGTDAIHLSRFTGRPVYGYDPHYFPTRPAGKYDTILCNYVLNTLPEDEWEAVIDDIKSFMKSGSKAYITVRNDKSRLRGYTSKKTYQTTVYLDLPVLYHTSNFRTYELTLS